MSHSFPDTFAAMLFAACLTTAVPTDTPAVEPLATQSKLSFQHVVVDDQPPRNPWTKLAGDFNGDGKLDIAIAGQNGPLVWYVNPGWQKVQIAEHGWSTVGGAVGDVDGDGDLDLIPGAQVWFENPRPKGDPLKDAWRAHGISKVGSHDVALVDLDHDGKPDLVARDQSSFGHRTGNRIHFWRQEAPDQWRHRAIDCPHGEGLAVTDLDRDGDADLIIGGCWFENDGRVPGNWTPHAFTTHWTWPDAKVGFGDLNGDGFTDIVLAAAELQGQRYRLAWYEAPRDATRADWQEHVVETPVETVMHSLAVADMDGDGQEDIVTARMHQGAPPQEVSVYLNSGKGNGWKKVTVSARGSHDILVADFNGDGRPDILGANHGGPHQPVELWLNQPSKRAAMRIWAVDDCVRINPQTGRAFEESAIYPAALRLKPGYRQHNWIFREGNKEVALPAAQNEVVAFQLQIESEMPLRKVSVEISDLRGPAPFRSADCVRLFKEWYVEVKQASHEGASAAGFDCLGLGWYPDALIPLDGRVKGEFGMPFDLPDRTNAVPGQKVQAVWVDVCIPPEQAPGSYEGAIRVTGQAGVDSVQESLRLRLEVFPFALPQQNHLGISLNDYGSISPRRMPREKLWAFYQLCHAHRCVLDVLYNAPKATGAGDALRLDWTEYDAAFGPLFDGSAFTVAHGYRGPGEGVPVQRFYLPFETSGGWAWPLPPEGMETAHYETTVKKALREFERHFLEKGWTRTKLMMFYNRYDESGRVKEISYFARLLREAGLREPGRFLYRVDGGTPAAVRGVGLEHVGVWCINGNVRYTHVAEQREIIRHGGQIWVYSSNSAREPCIGAPYLDTEALALRTWGWLPWKYRDSVSTMCEWGTFYHGNLGRWRDPSLATALGGKQVLNGDALLIYPGEFVGLDQPIPSIRLKMLRRASQDYEYLWLLAQRTGDVQAGDDLVAGVLFRAMHEALKPGQDYWTPGERDSRSHDPEQWDAARRRLAERILAATKK